MFPKGNMCKLNARFAKLQSEKVKERNNSRDLTVKGRIILQSSINWSISVCTGFNWFKYRISWSALVDGVMTPQVP
jgi:hypothetical protein